MRKFIIPITLFFIMVLSLTAVSAADINATSVSDESSDIDLSSANSEALKFDENQNFTSFNQTLTIHKMT